MCHPQTREKVLEMITNWVNDPHARQPIIWLNGPAGSGKTTIAQTIAARCSGDQLVASFFFLRNSDDRGTATRLFTTLAWQLAQNIAELLSYIESVIKKEPFFFTKSLDIQFDRLIVEQLQELLRDKPDYRPQKSLIIIDGVDECAPDRDQTLFLRLIGDALSKTHIPLRFLICSRPEAHIQEAFESEAMTGITYEVSLNDQFNPNDDIRRYLEGEFARVREEHKDSKLPPGWPPCRAIEQLVSKSSGQFIYASTVVKFVDVTYDNPRKRLDIVLDIHPVNSASPFAELDQLYTRILSQQPNLRLLRDLFTLIIALRNPKIKFVCRRLRIEEEELERELLKLRPLVGISHPDITVYHISLHDFLLDKKRAGKYFIHPIRVTFVRLPKIMSSARAPRNDIDPKGKGKAMVEDEDEDQCLEGEGIECNCCFTEYSFERMIQCPEGHLFCKSCVLAYASNQLGLQDIKLKCMDLSGCSLLYPESELRRVLPDKLIVLHDRLKQQKEIEEACIEGLEECPFCDYKCIMEMDKTQEKLFRCRNHDGGCGAVSCRECKRPDHLPKSCQEMDEDRILNQQHAIEEAMSAALMRTCPKCRKPFIKESGCNKIRCYTCRTVSCYICRKIIDGYDHFDSRTSKGGSSQKCPLWDAVEARHAQEVKVAAEKAMNATKFPNPDIDTIAMKLVDVPKIKPRRSWNINHPHPLPAIAPPVLARQGRANRYRNWNPQAQNQPKGPIIASIAVIIIIFTIVPQFVGIESKQLGHPVTPGILLFFLGLSAVMNRATFFGGLPAYLIMVFIIDISLTFCGMSGLYGVLYRTLIVRGGGDFGYTLLGVILLSSHITAFRLLIYQLVSLSSKALIGPYASL